MRAGRLSRLGLAGELRRASDAAILKAKIDVQLETARQRMARVVSDARESCEKRLLEGHAKLAAALH